MTASVENTWDIEAADGGPRRPSLDDVGGATLIDHPVEPPDPETMPYAAQLNQLQYQAAAVGKVVDSLAISVTFSGGTPSIASVTCARTDLPTFPAPSDNGTGDTTVSWPADTFPPPLVGPTVTINQDVGELVGVSAVATTNGVRVRTYRATGGAADLAFTVRIQ